MFGFSAVHMRHTWALCCRPLSQWLHLQESKRQVWAVPWALPGLEMYTLLLNSPTPSRGSQDKHALGLGASLFSKASVFVVVCSMCWSSLTYSCDSYQYENIDMNKYRRKLSPLLSPKLGEAVSLMSKKYLKCLCKTNFFLTKAYSKACWNQERVPVPHQQKNLFCLRVHVTEGNRWVAWRANSRVCLMPPGAAVLQLSQSSAWEILR